MMVQLMSLENFSEGDIASAVGYLLANDTIGDPIRGQTWGERPKHMLH